MPVASEVLLEVPFLSALTHTQRQEAAELLSEVRLLPGAGVWRQGDASRALVVVLSGRIEVSVDGKVVGEVGPGELLGEVGAFFRTVARSASVEALEPTRLLVMSRDGLRALRDEEARERKYFLSKPWNVDLYDEAFDSSAREEARRGAYSLLIHESLMSVLRRVRLTNERVAAAVPASERNLPRREASFLAGLVRRVTGGAPPSGEPPPIVPLLRGLPRLAGAPEGMIKLLAAKFGPVSFGRDEVIFEEGDDATCSYLLASGAVLVLRSADAGGAEELARLQPGTLFGINALIDPGKRTATCVAAEPVWAWRVEGEEFLAHRWTSEMGLLWRESLLALLVRQLVGANAALAAAHCAADPSQRQRAVADAVEAVAGAGYTTTLDFDL